MTRMLTTILAADPRTPQDTLVWLAQRPRLRSQDAVAMLTHPNWPDGAPAPAVELHGDDVHQALTNPATTAAARTRLLSHRDHETTWLNMSCYADLSEKEIRTAAPHRGTVPNRYGTVLRNPATPADVATDVLTSLLKLTPAPQEPTRLPMATAAIERGVALDVLTGTAMPTRDVVLPYTHALAEGRATSWHQYLLSDAGLTNKQMATLASVTTDPTFARDLTSASRVAAAVILGNLRMDEGTHLDAIVTLRDYDSPEGERFLRQASDTASLRVFDEVADPDYGTDGLIATVLASPHRAASTVEHIHLAHRRQRTHMAMASVDDAALALAPAITAEHRAQVLASHLGTARIAPTVAAQLRIGQAIHADPRGATHVAMSDLRRAAGRLSRDLVIHHLRAATDHLPLPSTPARIAVMLELEATFTGSVLDLLELSNAVSA